MAAAPRLLSVMIEAFMGLPDFNHDCLMQYQSPSTAQAAKIFSTVIELPNGGAIQNINLATLFPGATNVQFISIMDVTAGDGLAFKCDSLNVTIAPQAPLLWVQNGGVPPTIQLSQPGATASSVAIVVASL